jgi:hypothetical protein
VDEEHRKLIRGALERYLSECDPRAAAYRDLAKRHSLLPILPDWTGFVGLRDDGAVFWVSSEDDGSLSSDLNRHALHLALIRGAELFPELGFLTPTVSPDWVPCWSCGASGKVIFEGQELKNVRCLCGGMGSLPPDVANLLRASRR